VVRDVYIDDERLLMYETLDVLLRAGWHRAGVYCFWDPETRQPFYLGLAKDLPARFAQHNSLMGCRPGKGNKGEQINAWFSEHERLGFSVVLQEGMADETYEPFARNAEGQLLEGFRRVHSKLPPWNQIGGSRTGAGYVRDNSAAWVDLMTGRGDSLLVARRTIRGLNDDASAEYSELIIHPARTGILQFEGVDDHAIRRALGLIVERSSKFQPIGEDLGARLDNYLQQAAPHPESN
jgi:hypothetical protein